MRQEVLHVELPSDGLSPHLRVGVAAAGVAALGVLLSGMYDDADRLRAGASGQVPATAQVVTGASPQSGSAAPAPGGAAEPPSRAAGRATAPGRAGAPAAGAAPRTAGPTAGTAGRPVAAAPAPAAPSSPPTATAPPAVRAPAPGRYRYTVQVDDQVPSASRLDVSALRGQGQVRRSVETWGTSRTVTDTGWSATGARVLASGEGSGRCRWAPAVDDLRLPLVTGGTWTSSTRCDGGALTRVETTTSTVQGYDRVVVGDRRVFVWVIERRSTAQVSADGAVATSHTASSELFAPALGLPVLEVAQVRFPGAGGTEQVARAIRRLESVTPA